MPFNTPLLKGFPAVFWQTGRNNPFVSTGTEKSGFTGFSGTSPKKGGRF
jgi:hypothetical protein